MMKRLIPGLALLTTNLLVAQTTPDTKKESYHFDVSEVTEIDVSIDYSLGELFIEPNEDDGGIDGIIEYDALYVTPEVSYRAMGSKGMLDIEVETSKHRHGEEMWKGMEHKDYSSTVDFRLPSSVPLDTYMDFGLGSADIDLSGLDISKLKLECGLSDVKVTVDRANPGMCKSISIESGLGDFNAVRMGNLRTEEFHMQVGLGSATVDLTGALTTDLQGDIGVGLGSLDLLLPNNANIRLEVESTFLSSVDVKDLVNEGDKWVSPHWDGDLPTVELEISVGLGSVDVEIE